MTIVFGIRTRNAPGPSITFDCPHCGKAATTATTADRTESVSLFHIVPLFSLRNTFVTCGACKRQLLATLPASDPARLAPSQVARYVAGRVSFVTKCVVVLSLFLFWAPLIGLILSLAGLWAGWKHKGWIRTTATVTTIASVVVTLLVIFILIADR